ncbi:spermidine synthase [Pseudoblastomonas halimionae]|uniref:Spermidine synthase n=1 Tax=Alteriqipengyuania halimionae TaxID=1926630 RepID=A0A6I4U4D0_9SPHN|nr:fused MFS/spermidine synthase [Alteriqipengyuania halimionae]MXP10870.1 hypothetical protein [Alteriqipengyuania halimionae]
MTGRLPFLVTILAGSFLLFMVQPMVARLALPSLGGAPNVWNSAMLVYQALLLGGYAYAHFIGRFAYRTQVIGHVALLVLAALTLPIALADIGEQRQDLATFWVPLLFLASIGPLFFAVSAQAPLIQRWFGAVPDAGDPYPLYAASNFGSFAGLFAYPLLLEPYWRLETQTLAWALGYGTLVLLTAFTGWTMIRARRADGATAAVTTAVPPTSEKPSTRTILLWLALSAVPSGLMLSTTAHLTTDIVAMPLIWAIPLGLYLLSFTIAFADNRTLAFVFCRLAPSFVMLAGGLSLTGASKLPLMAGLASVAMLFVIAVALHSRLFALRPAPDRLTFFYLIMSAGGALGGVFAALVAPTLFDWVWEHPILVLASAALLPSLAWFDWPSARGLDERTKRIVALGIVLAAAIAAAVLFRLDPESDSLLRAILYSGIALCGVLLAFHRWYFVAVLAILMAAMGGLPAIDASLKGMRERSYFGVYTVRTDDYQKTLAHGTTLHGAQLLGKDRRNDPTTYYGPNSGVGLAMRHAGDDANIGVVGLGVGTLACYKRPNQHWTFFEIDPLVVGYSRDGAFTFVRDCAPDAEMVIGDARIELAEGPAHRYDVLAVDAFSSDSIPLHLLTREALQTYMRSLAPGGVLAVHISNRYIDLEPSLAALADAEGLQAMVRRDNPPGGWPLTSSWWVVLAKDKATLDALATFDDQRWLQIRRDGRPVWTDSHASVLPFIDWGGIFSGP